MVNLLYSLFPFHFSSVSKPELFFLHLISHSFLSTLHLWSSQRPSSCPLYYPFPYEAHSYTMWTMDSSDSSDLTMSDSFHGRKLRPLVPRPNASVLPKITVNSTVAISPCISHLHGTDLFALNHHLGICIIFFIFSQFPIIFSPL